LQEGSGARPGNIMPGSEKAIDLGGDGSGEIPEIQV
jgi:hypothetical protein